MVSSSLHSTYKFIDFSSSFQTWFGLCVHVYTMLLKMFEVEHFCEFCGSGIFSYKFQIHNRCKVRLEALTLMFFSEI